MIAGNRAIEGKDKGTGGEIDNYNIAFSFPFSNYLYRYGT
jgi:hypothetical protein